MTVQATPRKAGPFVGNGVSTEFSFSFKVVSTSHVQVVRASPEGVEEVLLLDSQYTVSLNGDQEAMPGGSVTLASPLANGERLVVLSRVPYAQTTDIPSSGVIPPEVLENTLDLLVMQTQQLAERSTRTVTIPASSGGQTADELLNSVYSAASQAGASAAASAASADASATSAANSATSAADSAASASLSSQHLVFVENFGAVGDGVTNDKDAIQAAIDYAASLGGGVVTGNPAKTYLVNSTLGSTRRGNSLVLASGVTLDMRGGTLKRTSGYEAIVTGPVGGVGGFFPQASGGSYYATDPIIPFYTMSGTYSAGGTSITLATAGDASNFAVGDYVAIRAGQLTDAAAPFDNQPIAEFNRIAGISGGVLALEWPLAKDYSPADNTAGAPHPYGVGRITPYVARGCAIRNTRFIVTDPTNSGSVRAVDVKGVIDFEMSGCYLDAAVPLITRGRFINVHDNRIHIRVDPASNYGSPLYTYSFAIDTGTSDFILADNTFTSEVAAWGHIQEGASNVAIVGNSFLMPKTAGNAQPSAVIGAFSRIVNLRIEGNTFVNAPGEGFIYIANNNPSWLPNFDHYGLVIANNTFRGTCTAFNAIRVHQPDSGPGAVISGNHIDVTLGAYTALYVHTNGPSTVTGNRLSPSGSVNFGANVRASGNSGIPDSSVYAPEAVLGSSAAAGRVVIDSPQSTFSGVEMRRAGVARWRAYQWDTAETGSNVGSEFRLASLADDGTTLTQQLAVFRTGGVILGNPTGGAKGTGTLNAQAVYDDNVLLTCYVLEAESTGVVDLNKWDALVPNGEIPAVPEETRVVTKMADEPAVGYGGTPVLVNDKPLVNKVPKEVVEVVRPAVPAQEIVRTHEPARRFAARAAQMLDPEQYAAAWKATGHLPAMPSPDEWTAADGKMAVGDVLQRLWETVEVQAVHIEKLRERITALEAVQPKRKG